VKKIGLHIIFCILLLSSCSKKTSWKMNLDKNSTEPYGLYLAYDRLTDAFPNAKKKPLYDLAEYLTEEAEKSYFSKKNDLLLSITSSLYLNKEEVDALYAYVEKGGQVLMLSQTYSKVFDTVFNWKIEDKILNYPPSQEDSITAIRNLWQSDWNLFEMDMPFPKSYFKKYKGKEITQKIIDSAKNGSVIFQRNIGKGKLIIGVCPELLTNYSLVKGNNILFYEQLLSNFSKRMYQVNWFSTFSVAPDPASRGSSLSKLLEKKPYRYAFYTLLAMALLFFLFETRRRQRIIKVVPPVKNDSLAFTEAIGKLYHSENDNANLARKMIRYYLEHIRTTYKIPTVHLNDEFATKLAKKLSKTPKETKEFVHYIDQKLLAYEVGPAEIKNLYYTLKKYS